MSENTEIGIGITGEDIEEKLPDKYNIETEGELTFKQGFDGWFCVILFNKNGSRRVSAEDSEKVIEALEDVFGGKWVKDGISNFVIHDNAALEAFC